MSAGRRRWLQYLAVFTIAAEVALGIIAVWTGHWFVAVSPFVAAIGIIALLFIGRRQRSRRQNWRP